MRRALGLVAVALCATAGIGCGSDAAPTAAPASSSASSAPSTTPAPATGGTPAWFDPEVAPAVYESGAHDVDAAAASYVDSRIDGATLGPAVVTNHPGAFDTATAVVSAAGVTGVVHLRVDGGDREWEVVGSFADDVELTSASYVDGRADIQGTNRSALVARLVRRGLGGAVIDEQPIADRAFDVATPTREPILLAIQLYDENVAVALTEVRVDAVVVDAIWPEQLTDEQPLELATRFAHEELGGRAELDATSIRPDAATITFRLFDPGGSEWSGVIVELKAANGRWFVTQAYSRDITVSFTVAPDRNALTYTLSSQGAQNAWLDTRAAGEGRVDALDSGAPDTLDNGSGAGTLPISGPLPRVLVVLTRSAELGDRYWLERITA